jgi:phosphatidate cytidylyltransferase
MLGWRLLFSAILIPALIGVFVLDHRAGESAPWLLGLVLLLVWRASFEFADLLKTRSFEPSFLMIACCSTAIVVAAWSWRFSPTVTVQLQSHLTVGAASARVIVMTAGLAMSMLAFALSVLAIFLRGAVRYREPGKTMETAGAEVLGVAYVGCLLTVTSQLRWISGDQAGYLVLASLVIAVKCGDTLAYTFGRLWGKRKMVPTLSPGKTWMGGVGALVGSSLGTWAWLHWAPGLFFDNVEPCPAGWSLLYGAILGVVGLIGDLAESLIKRDVEKKDSAALMPGFGGLLDLIDSVIFAGPVAFVLWLILPLPTWPVVSN